MAIAIRRLLATLAAVPLLSALTAAAAPLAVPATPASHYPASGVYNPSYRDPSPQVKVQWEVVAFNPVVAVHIAMVPGKDDVFWSYGRTLGKLPAGLIDWESGVYELTKRNKALNTLYPPLGTAATGWRNVSSPYNLFCNGAVQTADGKILVAGGALATPNGQENGIRAVHFYDFDNNPLHMEFLVNMSAKGRWYPTPTLLPNKKVLILGGSKEDIEQSSAEPFYEVWDPAAPRATLDKFDIEPVFRTKAKAIFYPYDFVLPTGDTWTMINDMVRFILPNGLYRMDPADPTKYLEVPGFPADVHTQYPASGAAAMMPLKPEDGYSSTEIMVLGGSRTECRYRTEETLAPAVRDLYRIKVSWRQLGNGDWRYTFGEWEKDDIVIPRSGHDATLLPNGDLVITNGGQTGCPGATRDGMRRNTLPAFWPVLYQHEKPAGERVTIMQASQIARMYHNNAALTVDGHILVAGCDQCGPDTLRAWGTNNTYQPWWSPTRGAGGREFRYELFYPPYAFDTNEAPLLQRLASSYWDASVVTAKYGQTLELEWSNKNKQRTGLVPISRVALVAPSSVTHGFNNNQRVVYLRFDVTFTDRVNADGSKYGVMNVVMPPNAAVAPPQQYLIFILHGKTYSRARWVHLGA